MQVDATTRVDATLSPEAAQQAVSVIAETPIHTSDFAEVSPAITALSLAPHRALWFGLLRGLEQLTGMARCFEFLPKDRFNASDHSPESADPVEPVRRLGDHNRSHCGRAKR